MRYAGITVIAVTVIVPAVLIPYGYEYNVHTASTVGGPLTLGICLALALGFDVVVWFAFGVVLVARSARKAAYAMHREDSTPG